MLQCASRKQVTHNLTPIHDHNDGTCSQYHFDIPPSRSAEDTGRHIAARVVRLDSTRSQENRQIRSLLTDHYVALTAVPVSIGENCALIREGLDAQQDPQLAPPAYGKCPWCH